MTISQSIIDTTNGLIQMRRAYGMSRAKIRRAVVSELGDHLIDGMTDRIIGMAADDMPPPSGAPLQPVRMVQP